MRQVAAIHSVARSVNASLAVLALRVQLDMHPTGLKKHNRYLSHVAYTHAPQWQVVADGPVWECARIEGQFGAGALDEAPDYEAEVQGALSLLVELDQV